MDHGNTYTILFTDCFSRHASMYTVTDRDSTAASTADILVHDYIEHYGFPERLLSDDGQQFCLDLSDELHKLLGIRKIPMSAHHPNGDNGGTERVTTL